MSLDKLRVTIVDDHALFAESLVIALTGEGYDARCVVPDASTTTFAQLGRSIVESRPNLVLLDLDLGMVGDAMRLLSALTGGGLRLVVVTGSADRIRRGEALAHGASAVLSKSVPFAEIVDAVRRTRNGLPVMSRSDRDELLGVYNDAVESQRELRSKFNRMTRREAEVLGQLMAGRQVTEIARTRFVSESTVRTQVKSILAKLQVSSQLTAVGLAHQIEWQPPADEVVAEPSGGRAPGVRPEPARVGAVRSRWNAAS